MLSVHSFTFNPFQENTYVVHDGKEAIIVDPGCWKLHEEQELESWLEGRGLRPVRLVLTHAHIDHVFGCDWVAQRYGLLPEVHRAELGLLRNAPRQGQMYGVHCEPSPEPKVLLQEDSSIELGSDRLDILFVPGHSPGHVALYCKAQGFVVAGDVLFNGSIGRTDLPGGDFDTLASSIRDKLYPLGDDVIVYCGHGEPTTIGMERRSNPFVPEV